MGRLGFLPEIEGENALPDALAVARLPELLVEGAFTHFAVADGGPDPESVAYTWEQSRKFAFAILFVTHNNFFV